VRRREGTAILRAGLSPARPKIVDPQSVEEVEKRVSIAEHLRESGTRRLRRRDGVVRDAQLGPGEPIGIVADRAEDVLLGEPPEQRAEALEGLGQKLHLKVASVLDDVTHLAVEQERVA
jgi:hypothetical protein